MFIVFAELPLKNPWVDFTKFAEAREAAIMGRLQINPKLLRSG
jgi:hypothetical protein